MDAIQQLSEQMQAHQQQFQESLQAHQQQPQQGLQGLTALTSQFTSQFQALAIQLQEIHEEQSAQFQSLDKRFDNIHTTLVEGFRGASDSFKSTSAEMVWEQSVSHARAFNLAARNTSYRRISPKPGKPAHKEADFPTDAFKIPFVPEDSCDRLARAWGIEFMEGATLDQKRGAVGRFLGCHMLR